MATRPVRVIALGLTLLVGAACGEPGKITVSKSTDPRSGGASGFEVPTAPTSRPATEPPGGATGEPSQTLPTTAVTSPVPADEGQAVVAAISAYSTALGTPSIRALELVVQLPAGQPAYAILQSQDPALPANVDERMWRNGSVGEPSPVVLTGSGDLEANLFSLDGINWAAIIAALPGAQAAVEAQTGPLSNSEGVTHLIATSDLPFSSNVVVRVYVDGGDRSQGGYVQYLADGTLEAVRA